MFDFGCVISEIEIGEELVTFYNGGFFGRGNKDCLCGNVEDHDKDSLSVDEISETVVTTKRRKRLKPAIKLNRSKKQSDLLGDMLRFYDELPSDSSTLKHSYLDQAVSSVFDAAMLEECVVPARLQTDTDVPQVDIWEDTKLENATALLESADFEISETSSDSESSGKSIDWTLSGSANKITRSKCTDACQPRWIPNFNRFEAQWFRCSAQRSS